MTFYCHSGGAVGADYAWDRLTHHYGGTLRLMVHQWHKIYGGNGLPKGWKGELYAYPDRELWKADDLMAQVSETIHRPYPPSSKYVHRLLQRNWCIVRHVNQVVGVSKLNKKRTLVDGGTGWGIHAAILKGIPVYVFDQSLREWFTWSSDGFIGCEVPALEHLFAGIGTRDINRAGIEAIKVAFDLAQF